MLSADGKSYKLTGTKQFITNAGFADLFTVFAKVDGEKFTGFLVERNTPGLTVGPEEHKLGIRGSSTCPLILEDCVVPADNVLGAIGQGHKIAFNILNIGRWKLGVGGVGGGQVLPGARRSNTPPSASSSASPSPSSISSARRSATSPPRSSSASRWPTAPPA